jgi:proline iminopeptidase
MVSRYPEIEPYETGLLEAGDGHRVYWEVCGNPNGKPAIFLHGGPGSGCSAGQRRFFDPAAYRAVLFDQRGAGRSRPSASDFAADLRTNTTPHLIADIELLRRHHRAESWTVLGISWGTTLGLAYAQAHPLRVSALVLALVTTTSRREVQWLTHDVGRIFPQARDRFASAVPEHGRPRSRPTSRANRSGTPRSRRTPNTAADRTSRRYGRPCGSRRCAATRFLP